MAKQFLLFFNTLKRRGKGKTEKLKRVKPKREAETTVSDHLRNEIMTKEETEYLIKYFLHLLPLEEKEIIKYPYLTEHEGDKERKRLAAIIKNTFNDKVFWNLCPKCKKLARTPKAKQCRYCKFDWHLENS